MNIQRMTTYTKPPLTIKAQIQLLRDRGLLIDDESELQYFLKNISYYHLSIYFKLFQTDDMFHLGTKFSDVVRVYTFDNKLRFLLLELLERVEKSFKARTACGLSTTTQLSHPHMSELLFRDRVCFDDLQQMFTDEVSRSKEISIAHYVNTYTEPELPPVWILLEILSFGQTVKFVKSLKREYRNSVSRTFGSDEQFVLSWMHSLSVLRNTCAHHSRLWNREHVFTPRKDHLKYKSFFVDSKQLFNQMVVLQIVLNEVNPSSSWLDKLQQIIEDFKIDASLMGFPANWRAQLGALRDIK